MDNFELRKEDGNIYSTINESENFPLYIRYKPENITFNNNRLSKPFEELIVEAEGIHNCCFIHRKQKGKNGKIYDELAIKFDELPFCLTAQLSRDEMTLREPTFSLKKMVLPEENDQYIEKKCNVKFVDLKEDTFKLIHASGTYWLSHVDDIVLFLKNCFSLPIPPIEIQIEEDKEMWEAYLEGLNAILENKRDLIKIQKVTRQKGGTIQLDFDMESYAQNLKKAIDEKLSISCEQDVEIEIEDGVCQISFDSFQIIPDETIDEVKNICRDFCYSEEDEPTNYVKGNIEIIADEEELKDITSHIDNELVAFGVTIKKDDTGEFILESDSDIDILKKIVEHNHHGIAEIVPTTRLIMPLMPNPDSINIDDLESQLPQGATITPFGNHFVVSSQKPINPNSNIFSNLKFVSCMVNVAPTVFSEEIEIPGATIKNNAYSWIIDSTGDLSRLGKLFNEVRRRYEGQFIKSSFKYAFIPQVPKEVLQQLKLKNYDTPNVTVDVPRSSVIFSPKSEQEYESIKSGIFEQLDEEISAIAPAYVPKAKIVFLTEDELFRRDIFETVNVALADKRGNFIKNKLSKDAKKLSFEFTFKDIDERDEIERILSESLNGIHGIKISYVDGNNKGFTQWTFTENPSLLQEVDRKLQSDYHGEFVNYINGKEYDKMSIIEEDDIKSIRFSPERIIKRKQYNYLKNNSYELGTCTRMTRSYAIIALSDDMNESLKSHEFKISNGDYIQFPSMGETMELRRQSIAMNRILKPENRFNKAPINPNLPNFIFDPKYASETLVNITEHMTYIRNQKISGNLNEKQLEAVTKSVLAPDIALIQGPPGTGKTTVIAEIIWQVIRENPDSRILLTSQTNLAVDNALERLQGQPGIRPVRIGKPEKLEPEGKRFSLSIIDKWTSENNECQDNATNIWIDRIISNVSNDPKYQTAVEAWREELSRKDKRTRNEFNSLYKKNVNLVAATCSICGSRDFLETYTDMFGETSDMYFDVVIMDEASKATPLEMAVPLVLGKKVIIIGDHKQLPPMMDENTIDSALEKIGKKELAEKLQKAESQFKRLFEAAAKVRKTVVSTLDTQYRMHKDIMDTIKQFYEEELSEAGGLKCGIEETMNIPDLLHKGSRWHGISIDPIIDHDTHALWIDVTSPEIALNPGFKNEGELEAIDLVLQALEKSDGYLEFKESQTKPEDKELGIITFYSAQSREIKKRYKDRGFRMDVVDRFQGMERNIIIVSTVRSNAKNNIGFAKEIERINVAFSRARRLLIVVGNKKQFENNSNYATAISAMKTISLAQLIHAVR